MAFTLPHERDRLLGVALSRTGEDFSDLERDLVNKSRPFLIQGYRNAVEYTHRRDAAGRGALLRALCEAGLSRREAEVVRLVALGRSSAHAADALALSERTVHKHLEHAYAKLGVHSRSEAATLAWSLAGGD